MAFNFSAPTSTAGSSTPKLTTQPLFGGTGSGTSSFSFGTTPSGNAGAADKSAAPTPGGLFSGQGSSTAVSTADNATSKPLFPTPAIGSATSTPLFPHASAAPTSSALFGSTAPAKIATSTAGALSVGTTTASNAAGGGGLFGGGPFSGSASTITASTPAKPALFSGFGSTTPAGAPPTTTKPVATTGLFGNASSATTLAAANTGSNGLFGSSSQQHTTTSTTSSFNSSTPTPTATGGLFGSASSAAPTPATTSAALAGSSLFTNPATPAAASSLFSKPAPPAATTSTATPSLFGTKPAATPVASTAASTSAGSLFSLAATPSTTSAAAAPASTTAPATGSLFSGTPVTTSATTTGTSTTAPATTTTTSAATSGPAACAPSTTPLGSSTTTSGPTSQLARLKNRTMDEIISRWATDLDKYQKDFQGQAKRIKEWDQKLVENGEKIQKLYLETYEAERASNEIDRQLQSVESQQDELAAWLDRYEREAEELLNRQASSSLPDQQKLAGASAETSTRASLAGPDKERDQMYKLAERLIDRMDDMSKDMTKMIKEINDISSTLSKTGKADDPLSQIVRVLNGHLSQLQWIDANATAIQAKVVAAKKTEASNGSGLGGLDNDAAEGFYRSYMGRR